MKVLFITRGWPTKENPMSGNYDSVQAKAVAAKGHDVTALVIKWRSFFHIFECGKLKFKEDGGVRVYECTQISPYIPGFSWYQFELFFRKRMFKWIFTNYLKKEPMPDVVHAHLIYYAAPASVLKGIYGLPFVITEHWSKANGDNVTPRVITDSIAYHKADKVIAVSKQLANSMNEKFGVEPIVIHNMVENRFFEPSMIKRERHSDFRFVSVGSLFPIKCFDILIKAFAQMQNKNATLDIVGGGTLKGELQELINQYGLQNRVCLRGMKTPEEVSAYLSNSDCFVLASRSETFGIVLIEAMAKGLPVISTRSGGPEEFVNEDNGILVPLHDPSTLAVAMDYMVANVHKYDSEKIRKYCYSNFSQDKIAEEIINVYKTVIEKTRLITR